MVESIAVVGREHFAGASCGSLQLLIARAPVLPGKA
jgi:hypothetical protein